LFQVVDIETGYGNIETGRAAFSEYVDRGPSGPEMFAPLRCVSGLEILNVVHRELIEFECISYAERISAIDASDDGSNDCCNRYTLVNVRRS
jgi:hypothetical protein